MAKGLPMCTTGLDYILKNLILVIQVKYEQPLLFVMYKIIIGQTC